ncbi:hypothetical protein DFP75_102540 [Marinomonas alcarazii]|uniref:Lipoprotein n=1 Tax=Marinomonas alcarazii TaxID=491949 RepID=A0A318V4C2_9GAMM|nr:hypothetical protein [Marinomonas alcarazii]PYF83444.1 hypothetical protein DFP75_102540 [Marinomonas alcarazii]
MLILRSGLLLATLLLSACSMPIFQDLPSSKTENVDPSASNNTPVDSAQSTDDTPISSTADNTSSESTSTPVNKVSATDNLTQQLRTQQALAKANYAELTNRMGKAPQLPSIANVSGLSSQQINDATQQLRSYVSKTNSTLASLNARVEDRQKVALNGDIIRIFLSEATVSHDNQSFKAQPLVGQWIRGESRAIRLKDNILFEAPKSEDLNITFSETYQLIVNNKVIATINPNREKNDANFTVPTHDNKGSIVGKLDFRVVEDE